MTELVERSPSLRGIMLGYVAELQLLKQLLAASPDIRDLGKADDHDRSSKSDRLLEFKVVRIRIESKSLQSNMARRARDPQTGVEHWVGKAQVDASDRRTVTFPDKSRLGTTCLLRGGFDLLAVNCFAFEQRWWFAYARNSDLSGSTYKKHSTYQHQHRLASLVTVTWPPSPPFYADPLPLLESLARERRR